MEDEWKSIEPNMWKPKNEGDQIIGVLVNKEPKDEARQLSARYYLENQKGMFLVWGCTILDDRMQYVKLGQKARITYKGKTKNAKNQDVNLYSVDVAQTTVEETQDSDSETETKQTGKKQKTKSKEEEVIDDKEVI